MSGSINYMSGSAYPQKVLLTYVFLCVLCGSLLKIKPYQLHEWFSVSTKSIAKLMCPYVSYVVRY